MNQTQTNQTDTLKQIRDNSEHCSEHLHNTLAESRSCKRNQTDSGNAPSEWKDTPRSTAEQIEISLRRGNQRKDEALSKIIANCDLILASSDNKQAKEFAKIIQRIALL